MDKSSVPPLRHFHIYSSNSFMILTLLSRYSIILSGALYIVEDKGADVLLVPVNIQVSGTVIYASV